MVVTTGREEEAALPKVRDQTDMVALEEIPCEEVEVVEVQRPSTTMVVTMTTLVATMPRKATM